MQATVSPVQSKAHPVGSVPLVQYRDGSIYAMSQSEPGRVYRVTVAPLSCQCRGFAYRGACCHSAAALERFGPACYWCDSTANVEVYVNTWDNGAELSLCAACFTPKEVA